MAKQCNYDGCKFGVFSHGYCKLHQNKRTDEKYIASKSKSYATGTFKKPIATASAKRKVINSQRYEPKARQFRAEKRICEVCPVLKGEGIKVHCSGKAEAVHHIHGKATIELLLDQNGWLASCFWGNGWIEDNSQKAFELGLKVPDYSSKLSKFKK